MDLSRQDQLRKRVYEYMRNQLRTGIWKPGDSVSMNELAQELGISKTPLRDALIRLETEGFVTILPQRGIIINSPSNLEIKYICEILGALESKIVMTVFHKIGAKELSTFKRLDEKLLRLASRKDGNFKEYVDANLEFHNVFLNLSENFFMVDHIRLLKRRVYDFPVPDYGSNWRHTNVDEHQKFLQLIEAGKAREAADFMRDVHWVYRAKEWHQLEPQMEIRS